MQLFAYMQKKHYLCSVFCVHGYMECHKETNRHATKRHKYTIGTL